VSRTGFWGKLCVGVLTPLFLTWMAMATPSGIWVYFPIIFTCILFPGKLLFCLDLYASWPIVFILKPVRYRYFVERRALNEILFL
jgi:hypothetical protein